MDPWEVVVFPEFCPVQLVQPRVATVTSLQVCTCSPGYTGDPQAGCTEVDPCRADSCGDRASCSPAFAPRSSPATYGGVEVLIPYYEVLDY